MGVNPLPFASTTLHAKAQGLRKACNNRDSRRMFPEAQLSFWGGVPMRPAEVQSDMIQYPGKDGTKINAYLSHPAAPGRYPGVIVIIEAFGWTDNIQDVARRFAAEGYVALAPDMYTREGSPDPSNIDS